MQKQRFINSNQLNIFRALNPPTFRSTILRVTTNCNTQSSAPEDGRDKRPKHVELIGINKPLLLHLVGVYIVYICEC